MACFNDSEELLYLFEILIEDLELTADKIHESGDNPLIIKIKFLSLPVFTVSPKDFETTDPISAAESKTGRIPLSTGKSCLFGKRPRNLLSELQMMPLRIGIFCEGDTYPIAEAILPFTGCVCDQIAMAMNDSDHMPKPYVLRGSYGLLDPGGNPSGSLNLVVKIGCQGKYVTTDYQMKENSFVFKNDREEGQYSVQRVVPLVPDIEEAQKVDSGISEIHRESLEEITDEGKQRRRSSKKKANKKKKEKN